MFIRHKTRQGSISSSGTIKADKFLGIGGDTSFVGTSERRADSKSYFNGVEQPGMLNMIRSAAGNVSKRAGFRFSNKLSNKADVDLVRCISTNNGYIYIVINGNIFTVYDSEFNKKSALAMPYEFYDTDIQMFDDFLFVMSQDHLLVFNIATEKWFYLDENGFVKQDVASLSYTPTIFIAKSPEGVGVPYQPVNLLSTFVAEQFIVSDGSVGLKTHYTPQNVSTYVKIASGEWKLINGYILDGYVKLMGFSDMVFIEGEDNVRVVYQVEDFKTRPNPLTKCKLFTSFGISGYKDRVFLSGNSDYKNYIYYSEMDNPLYFPDTNYIRVGGSETEVMGLAGHDTTLSVICNDCVYSISGQLNDKAMFTVDGIFKTPQPAGFQRPVIFDGEVVYMTNRGLCSITPSGVLDERFCQIRSAFINHHLLKENISECQLCVVGDFLIISNGNGRLYLLDGTQYSVSNTEPFSHRQYEGYIWDGIQAKNIWNLNDKLMFCDGQYIYGFVNGLFTSGGYYDEFADLSTRDICAYWETPYMYGPQFHKEKFFYRLGVLTEQRTDDDGNFLQSDIRIYVKYDNNDWKMIMDYGEFQNRDSLYRRILHKKGRGIKLRFENNNADEVFILREFCIDYNIM